MAKLAAVAAERFDGHVTVMKFTTNWRVGFGTPASRCDIDQMWEGTTFADAAKAALCAQATGGWLSPRCQTHEMLSRDGVSGECPYCGDILP
jgi:hypothetical protein